MRPSELAQDIREVVSAIERECESQVIVTLIEPRIKFRRAAAVTQDDYRVVAESVNRRLKTSLREHVFFNFTAPLYRSHLADDGVHFNAEGQQLIVQYIHRKVAQEVEKFFVANKVPGPFRP